MILKKVPIFLLILSLSAICMAVDSQSPVSLEEKVDRLFAEWDKPDSPGVALAVIKNGSIVYKRGYGSANLEYNIPITPATVFQAASVSKQFTAFAIALLAQKKKLSPDDDIRKYLTELPDFGTPITIKHLIHHTSGLIDIFELLCPAGWRMADVFKSQPILNMLENVKKLNFAPGEKFSYTNTGYILLAEIVEKVTGQSFRDWTKENMFKPLGMSNTHFLDDFETIVKNRAYSYQPAKEGGVKKSVLSFSAPGPTNLFTTLEDMAKWVQNFSDARVGGRPVIEQMHEVGTLNNGEKTQYAFGQYIGTYRGLKAVSHSGGHAGFRNFLIRFPEHHLAVVFFSNLSSFHPGRIVYQVADIYLPQMLPKKSAELAAPKKAVSLKSSSLKQYEGVYYLESDKQFLVIKEENNSLTVQGLPGSKFSIQPEAENKFFINPRTPPFFFHRNKKGDVTSLEYRGEHAKKHKEFNPTEEELKEFTGKYYSPELDAKYTFTIKNGCLVARHVRLDDVPLNPVVTDHFGSSQWWFQLVKFKRDPNGAITGFGVKVYSGREIDFSMLNVK
jgi:CubicO group peptidase (beta-lactamase class C family)